MTRLPAAGLSCLAMLLVLPSLAGAATVSRVSNTVIISASDAERSRLQVYVAVADDLMVTGRPGSITAAGGCDPVGDDSAFCGSYASATLVSAFLGDLDDRMLVVWPRADPSPPEVGVSAGGGDDRIIGGHGESRLVGGSGADLLGGEHPCCGDRNEGGEDVLQGGPGRDRLFGGEDADELVGGSGIDTLDFAASPTRGSVPAVRVALNRGVANGAGDDTVRQCERVIGSDRADVLIGSGGRNTLWGRDGRDRLVGRGGRDDLLGQAQSDRLRARDGRRDLVNGGPGRDRGAVDAVDLVRSVELP